MVDFMKNVALMLVLMFMLQPNAMTQSERQKQNAHESGQIPISLDARPFGAAWGMVYGFPLSKPVDFLPTIRKFGVDFTKVNLFWSQIEPERGQYNWAALDPFLDQLQSPDEAILALFSASPWATRDSTWAFPPSPAKDQKDYYRFVHDVVVHTKGKIRYFQNGSVDEFEIGLKTFYRAVKDADPSAKVVLGGCDGLFDPGGQHQIPGQEASLAFFNQVMKVAGDSFDVFDLHLYADPYTIPARVEYFRNQMRSIGYSKPIIATEYNGPGFFEFSQNRKYFGLMQSWSESVIAPAQSSTSTGPPGNRITELYERQNALAPETQMFLMGCSPELQHKLEHIQARDLVMRNVLALSAGVQKMAFWDVWHDTSKRDDLQTLMFGKLKLAEFNDQKLTMLYPLAEVYQRMTTELRGVTSIKRIALSNPDVYVFEVTTGKGARSYVAWRRGDAFNGESLSQTLVSFPVSMSKSTAIDVFGKEASVTTKKGNVIVDLSITPIFIRDTR